MTSPDELRRKGIKLRLWQKKIRHGLPQILGSGIVKGQGQSDLICRDKIFGGTGGSQKQLSTYVKSPFRQEVGPQTS